jgi:hypothetical protein
MKKSDPITIILCLLLGLFIFVFCLIFFPQSGFIKGIAAKSIFFYAFFLVIAGPVLYIFSISFHFVLTLTSNAVVYRKAEKNNFLKRIVRVFLYFLGLTTLVILAILSLLQIPLTNINQFIYLFPIAASLLISLRFLANPTKKFYSFFWKNDPDIIPDSDKKVLIRYREEVISFYFSLIQIAILILILGLFYQEISINFITSFETIKNNTYGFAILIIAYIITLAILTSYCEYFLDRWELVELD